MGKIYILGRLIIILPPETAKFDVVSPSFKEIQREPSFSPNKKMESLYRLFTHA